MVCNLSDAETGGRGVPALFRCMSIEEQVTQDGMWRTVYFIMFPSHALCNTNGSPLLLGQQTKSTGRILFPGFVLSEELLGKQFQEGLW